MCPPTKALKEMDKGENLLDVYQDTWLVSSVDSWDGDQWARGSRATTSAIHLVSYTLPEGANFTYTVICAQDK